MKRIRELSNYQKAILLILAAMTLIFGIVYIRATSQKGYAFREQILLPSCENGNTVYSGDNCSFTVTPDKTVTFRYLSDVYGPYTAKEDATAIPAKYANRTNCTGIVLYDDGKEIFRGAALTYPQSGFELVYENGEMVWNIVVSVSGGVNVSDSRKPTVKTILELMGQPELTPKGEWGFFFMGLFVCLGTSVSILFADELFRLSFVFTLRDWDTAEPSDFEIAGRYIGWTLLPILNLWVYFQGLH